MQPCKAATGHLMTVSEKRKHLHVEVGGAAEAWRRQGQALALLTGRGAPPLGHSMAAQGRLMRRPEAVVGPTAALQLQGTTAAHDQPRCSVYQSHVR